MKSSEHDPSPRIKRRGKMRTKEKSWCRWPANWLLIVFDRCHGNLELHNQDRSLFSFEKVLFLVNNFFFIISFFFVFFFFYYFVSESRISLALLLFCISFSRIFGTRELYYNSFLLTVYYYSFRERRRCAFRDHPGSRWRVERDRWVLSRSFGNSKKKNR